MYRSQRRRARRSGDEGRRDDDGCGDGNGDLDLSETGNAPIRGSAASMPERIPAMTIKRTLHAWRSTRFQSEARRMAVSWNLCLDQPVSLLEH